MKNKFDRFIALPLILACVACSSHVIETESSTIDAAPTSSSIASIPTEVTVTADSLTEAEVREIKLPAPYDDTRMEYSSMAWMEDALVLLPQYPRRLGKDGSAFLVTIQKEAILAYLNLDNKAPIETGLLEFDDGGLSETLEGFEGFEAIAFAGEQVFMTIETSGGSPMMGYLVSGLVDNARQSIRLDPGTIVPLLPQTDFRNAGDESLIVENGVIYTFFEDNGAVVNPNSFAHAFDINLDPLADSDFPGIEFRVTDATEIQPDGSFWVMNYFYPGDSHLKAKFDPLVERYGEGGTHSRSFRVERIIKLRIEDGQIVLADEAPLYLNLNADGSSRNWEGLVRLDDLGFLAVTDSFPGSFLGFIPDLR